MLSEPIPLHAAKSARSAIVHVGVAVPRYEQAALRNEVDQPLEGGLHFVEVLVNIGVIELDRGEDDGIRKIVEKLWPLVEEGGIVFVALDDEYPDNSQGERTAEVFRYPADEKTGGTLAFRKQPRHQGGRGGLAMRARHYQAFVPGKELFVQHLRHRPKRDALVEYVLEFGVAARDGVAHNHQIGARFQVDCAEGLSDCDVQRRQEVRHRRICGGVGASDAMTALL